MNRLPSVTNALPARHVTGEGPDTKPPLKAAPRGESGLGPVQIPRARVPDMTADLGFFDKSVAAVLLGAGAVGALVAPAAARAETADPARGLEATRVLLEAATDADTLGTARREAWSTFVRDSVDTAVAEEAIGPIALVDLGTIVIPEATVDLSKVPLTGSVGAAGANAEADVTAVQTRLAELGFNVGIDGDAGGETRAALRLFEAQLTGEENVSSLSGKVVPGSTLHKALASTLAPRWEKIPASGTGFVNGDTDHHSYASARTVSVIKDAGARYHTNHLATNADDSLITTNDASRKKGGDTGDHDTHEAGLDLDIRLPRKDGTAGTKVTWSSYDREAAYGMIASFAADARVERVLIGDSVLLNRIASSDVAWKDKVADGGWGHRDHIHIDVSPVEIIGVTASGATIIS